MPVRGIRGICRRGLFFIKSGYDQVFERFEEFGGIRSIADQFDFGPVSGGQGHQLYDGFSVHNLAVAPHRERSAVIRGDFHKFADGSGVNVKILVFRSVNM